MKYAVADFIGQSKTQNVRTLEGKNVRQKQRAKKQHSAKGKESNLWTGFSPVKCEIKLPQLNIPSSRIQRDYTDLCLEAQHLRN
jgi:hypothetical protein